MLDGTARAETGATDVHRAIEAIWRIESARLIAGLARLVGDIGTAEELAQDALVAALEQWPASGVPEKPGAWLARTAKHRAIDLIRRRKTSERKHNEIGRDVERAQGGLDVDTMIARTWATICSASSSWRATRSFRRTRVWRSRCACSGV